VVGGVTPRGRARDSYVRLPRTWDLLPDDLIRLAALTGQPASVLTQLTALPLFHTVCGAAMLPTAVAIHHFFHPRGSLKTVALHRRFCPRCLQEALVYRLLWQVPPLPVL